MPPSTSNKATPPQLPPPLLPPRPTLTAMAHLLRLPRPTLAAQVALPPRAPAVGPSSPLVRQVIATPLGALTAMVPPLPPSAQTTLHRPVAASQRATLVKNLSYCAKQSYIYFDNVFYYIERSNRKGSNTKYLICMVSFTYDTFTGKLDLDRSIFFRF